MVYSGPVHLETLRLYCDVVRLRSFSKGAEQNFVSQSAASQAVQQLETQVGAPLIDRTKRPFAVSPQGKALYEACRSMLAAWEQAKAEVAAVKARLDGTVRVAAIYSVGLHDVSRPMQQFASLYPAARVQLECLHPHKVVEAVINGDADLGIMSYPPSHRSLTLVPFRVEPMAVVCPPNHPFARPPPVLPPHLAPHPPGGAGKRLRGRGAVPPRVAAGARGGEVRAAGRPRAEASGEMIDGVRAAGRSTAEASGEMIDGRASRRPFDGRGER